MNWTSFEKSLANIVRLARQVENDSNASPNRREIDSLKPLCRLLLDAHDGMMPLPKRAGGRPRKTRKNCKPYQGVHDWEIAQFAEQVINNQAIDYYLFQKVAIAAFTIRNGIDPEVAFRMTESRTETRGPIKRGARSGIQLDDIDVAAAVIKETRNQRAKKNRNPKTFAYDHVGSDLNISADQVQRLYLRAMNTADGKSDQDKENLLLSMSLS